VRLRNDYPIDKMPSEVAINAIVESKSKLYKLTKKFTFEAFWAFKLDHLGSLKIVELTDTARKRDLLIQSSSYLDVEITDPLLRDAVTYNYDESKGQFRISISIPKSVKYQKPIDAAVRVTNPKSSQSEFFRVYFDPSRQTDPEDRGSSWSFSLTDYVVLAILLTIIVILFMQLKNSVRENKPEEYIR